MEVPSLVAPDKWVFRVVGEDWMVMGTEIGAFEIGCDCYADLFQFIAAIPDATAVCHEHLFCMVIGRPKGERSRVGGI